MPHYVYPDSFADLPYIGAMWTPLYSLTTLEVGEGMHVRGSRC